MKLNSVQVIGNLVTAPEPVRYLPSGQCVGKLAIAVNEVSGSGDNRREEVSYVDVVTWGKVADNCAAHLVRGQQVLVEGRLKQERWETEGGAKRSKIVIVANRVQFGAKPKGYEGNSNGDNGGVHHRGTEGAEERRPAAQQYGMTGSQDDEGGAFDDLPF